MPVFAGAMARQMARRLARQPDIPAQVGFAVTAGAALAVSGLAADDRTVGLVLLTGVALAAGMLTRLRAALPAVVLAWLFAQSLLYSPAGDLRFTHPGELALLAAACLVGAVGAPLAALLPDRRRGGRDRAD